jgi:hypothetical protein
MKSAQNRRGNPPPVRQLILARSNFNTLSVLVSVLLQAVSRRPDGYSSRRRRQRRRQRHGSNLVPSSRLERPRSPLSDARLPSPEGLDNAATAIHTMIGTPCQFLPRWGIMHRQARLALAALRRSQGFACCCQLTRPRQRSVLGGRIVDPWLRGEEVLRR